jgi:hypothetical protein
MSSLHLHEQLLSVYFIILLFFPYHLCTVDLDARFGRQVYLLFFKAPPRPVF